MRRLAILSLGLLAACAGTGDDGASPTTEPAAATTTAVPTTTTTTPEPTTTLSPATTAAPTTTITTGSVTGVVLTVDGDLESVDSFTILADGIEYVFVPAEGLQFHDGPLSHLNSHRLSGGPVTVEFEDDGTTLVATSVADAD